VQRCRTHADRGQRQAVPLKAFWDGCCCDLRFSTSDVEQMAWKPYPISHVKPGGMPPSSTRAARVAQQPGKTYLVSICCTQFEVSPRGSRAVGKVIAPPPFLPRECSAKTGSPRLIDATLWQCRSPLNKPVPFPSETDTGCKECVPSSAWHGRRGRGHERLCDSGGPGPARGVIGWRGDGTESTNMYRPLLSALSIAASRVAAWQNMTSDSMDCILINDEIFLSIDSIYI